MTKTEFANLFIKVLEYRYVDYVFKLNDDLSITAIPDNGKDGHTIFVDNAYMMYQQQKSDPEGVITDYVNGMYGSFYDISKGQINLQNVIPIIKPHNYVEEVAKKGGADGVKFKLAQKPYNSQLSILYAEDNVQTLRYLSNYDIVNAGETIDSVHKRSLVNLKKYADKRMKINKMKRAYFVELDGNKEASLILLEDIWTKKNFKIEGEIVIGIPCRSLLVLIGSENDYVLSAIKMMVRHCYASDPYPVSSGLFILKNGKFVAFR